MKEDSKVSGALGMLGGVAGQILGNVFGGMGDARQLRQQKKLNEEQMKNSKEMADHNWKNQLAMWEATNYKPQVEEMRKAGLNPALMYGMGGAGGATTGSGGSAPMGGASASDGASNMQAGTQMAMMLSQQKLMEAQTRKTEAEADKIAGTDTAESQARTKGQEFQNELNSLITSKRMMENYDAVTQKLEAESTRAIADWETYAAVNYKGKTFNDPESPVARAMRAGYEEAIENLKQAKEETDIKKAENVIKEFEANMAKEGLAPNSPWYVKFLGDLINEGKEKTKGLPDTIKKINQMGWDEKNKK